MAAKHLVLGLIVRRPDYGYSLKQRFNKEFGDTEFAASMIYSALTALEREGLIERVGEPRVAVGRRGSVRTRYRATQRGVAEFDGWMIGPSQPTPMRAELRSKLALCEPRHVPALIDAAWAQEQQCLDRLKELQSADGVALDDCSTLTEGVEALLLDADVAFLQTTIETLRKMRAVLRRLGGEYRGGRIGPGLRGV
ncbi:MAG TPA: PadR family transcriptional regulator [Solirubrobacteraceae bacterium]|jgi:DNA-binding PadR family transcriptional regulator|nr:PadR family transcriptional regulator [Solirubrobacteraceae bacterium]